MAIKNDCHSLKFAGSLVDALSFQHSLRGPLGVPSCIELINNKTSQLAFPVFCMNISSDNTIRIDARASFIYYFFFYFFLFIYFILFIFNLVLRLSSLSR